MPLRSTDSDSLRLTRVEFQELTDRARKFGYADQMPHKIKTQQELQEAEQIQQESLLLKLLFGEAEEGDAAAREAYDRGEITEREVLGMSREEMQTRTGDQESAPRED